MSIETIAAEIRAAGKWVSYDHRVDEETAADFLGCTSRTMRTWRKEGIGPAFIPVGRITYRLADLIAYVEARKVSPLEKTGNTRKSAA